MVKLTKVTVGDNIPNVQLNTLLSIVMNYEFIPNSIYFTNGDIVINNKSKYSYKLVGNKIIKLNKINRIPINFNNTLIWKQIESFDQNNTIMANKIRNKVISLLEKSLSRFLFGIGGEYYGYFCSLPQYEKYIGYTNNKYIHQDAIFNMNLHYYYKQKDNQIISYNDMEQISNIYDSDCIVNLSKIPLKVIEFLNNNNFKKIIIISCNNKNDKRIKMLNYKIINVFQFTNVELFYLNN